MLKKLIKKLYIMCGGTPCGNCKGVKLLKGNGIKSVTDNGDGTLTILFDNGDTFTTSDFTGPPGAAGNDGDDGQGIDHVSVTNTAGLVQTITVWGDAGETINLGTYDVEDGSSSLDKNRIVYSNMSVYSDTDSGTNGFSHSEPVSSIPSNGDGLHVTCIIKQLSGSAGTFGLVVQGIGAGSTVKQVTFGGVEDETYVIDCYLIRSGTTLKTSTRIFGSDGTGAPLFSVDSTTTLTSTLAGTNVTVHFLLDSGDGNSTIEDVVITVLKQ